MATSPEAHHGASAPPPAPATDEGALPASTVVLEVEGDPRKFTFEQIMNPVDKWVESGKRGGLTYDAPDNGRTTYLKQYQITQCLLVPPDVRYMLEGTAQRNGAYSCPNNPTTQRWWRTTWTKAGSNGGAGVARSFARWFNDTLSAAQRRAALADVRASLDTGAEWTDEWTNGRVDQNMFLIAERSPDADRLTAVWRNWRALAAMLWRAVRTEVARRSGGDAESVTDEDAEQVRSALVAGAATRAYAKPWFELRDAWESKLRKHMPRDTESGAPTTAEENPKLGIGALVQSSVGKMRRENATLREGGKRRGRVAEENIKTAAELDLDTGPGAVVTGGTVERHRDQRSYEEMAELLSALSEMDEGPGAGDVVRADVVPASEEEAEAADEEETDDDDDDDDEDEDENEADDAVMVEATDDSDDSERAEEDDEADDEDDSDDAWLAGGFADALPATYCASCARYSAQDRMLSTEGLWHLARHHPRAFARVRKAALGLAQSAS